MHGCALSLKQFSSALCSCRVSKKTLEINPNNPIIQARPAVLGSKVGSCMLEYFDSCSWHRSQLACAATDTHQLYPLCSTFRNTPVPGPRLTGACCLQELKKRADADPKYLPTTYCINPVYTKILAATSPRSSCLMPLPTAARSAAILSGAGLNATLSVPQVSSHALCAKPVVKYLMQGPCAQRQHRARPDQAAVRCGRADKRLRVRPAVPHLHVFDTRKQCLFPWQPKQPLWEVLACTCMTICVAVLCAIRWWMLSTCLWNVQTVQEALCS